RGGEPDVQAGHPGRGRVAVSPAGVGAGARRGGRARHRGHGKRPAVGCPVPNFHSRRDARGMIVSFDTNIFLYAIAPSSELRRDRARDVLARGMRGGFAVLLWQTLAEFSSVAIRTEKIPV